MVPELLAAMNAAVAEIDRQPWNTVKVLHHNDADGISSGAILTRAFERRGFTVNRLCLEKPYPVVLERVLERPDQLIVLTDFGGRIAPLISELNQGRNLVLILDHHKAQPASDSRVHNLDPELYGLLGDRDITASTTCFLFARILGPSNEDLAPLATIGAVGDGFLVAGRLAGPNRLVAIEASNQGLLRIDTDDRGHEQYAILSQDVAIPCRSLADDLDVLGAAGYSRGGPAVGVGLCLDGPSEEADRMLGSLRELRDRAFAEEISRIRKQGLVETAHIQWLQVDDRFMPMGVKAIGAFLDTIKNSEIVDPERYLAGFQKIPDQVPGFGTLGLDQVKISMRVSDRIAARIRSGTAPGLDTFLPAATNRLGGFSDACHSLAAATTVDRGREAELIDDMEKVLAGQ